MMTLFNKANDCWALKRENNLYLKKNHSSLEGKNRLFLEMSSNLKNIPHYTYSAPWCFITKLELGGADKRKLNYCTTENMGH